MTVSIAITGKSGSGKTSVTKAIFNLLRQQHQDKSFLLVDNDLSRELANSFGIDIKETLYDIRSGKYKYKSKLPDNLSKQEYMEWALQDIVVNLFEDVDIIESGYISARDCNCYTVAQTKDALKRLFKNYDIVIFDCEYDLEYLLHFVDYPPDVTIVIADTSIDSVYSAVKIKNTSEKLASPGQFGVVINRVKDKTIPEHVTRILHECELDILGFLPYDENIKYSGLEKKSKLLEDSVSQLLFRLNLPPI